jgi:hypothetical protein
MMEMPKFPTLVMFLMDIQKVFQATDQVWDAVNRLEMLRQGKKTVEELITEFRKVLEPRLSCRILFSDDVPKMIDR